MDDDQPAGDECRRRRTVERVVDGGHDAIDRVLEALASTRRRRLLYYLLENDPADIEECAAAVVAAETEASVDAVTEDKRKEMEASLYHYDLPKLADLEIIEYDQRSGAIRSHNPPPHFDEFLQLARDIEAD